MTNKWKKYLRLICKKCIHFNGKCIKNETYIGLCADNDKDEIILFTKKKRHIQYEKRK